MKRVEDVLSEVHESVQTFSTSTDKYLEHNEQILADPLPVALKVQTTTDGIKKIKFDLVAIRAKELFLQKVKASGDEDLTDDFISLFPSTTEQADLEINLAQEKSTLRSIKEERRLAEEQLPEVAASYAVAHASLTKAKEDIEDMVRTVHYAEQNKVIQQVLQADDLGGLEELLQETPDLYEDSVALLMDRLASETQKMRKDMEDARKEENLALAALAAEEEELGEQTAELEKVMKQIENHERSNVDSQSLRQQVLEQDLLLEISHALTGIEIDSIGNKNVSVCVKPAVFDVRGTSCDVNAMDSIQIQVKNGINSRATRTIVTSRESNTPVETDLCSSGVYSSVPVALSRELSCLVERAIK